MANVKALLTFFLLFYFFILWMFIVYQIVDFFGEELHAPP